MSNIYNNLTKKENKTLAEKEGWYRNSIDGNSAYSLKDDGDYPEYYYYENWAELVFYQDIKEGVMLSHIS